MKLLFVCKASTEIGLGHLIRSRTLASGLHALGGSRIDFTLIGDRSLISLVNGYVQEKQAFSRESEFSLSGHYDIVFVDMLEMTPDTMKDIRARAALVVCLSPIFNLMGQVDLLFSRTRYQTVADSAPGQVFAGLEYTLIQDDCSKIGAGAYESTLESGNFPIAICMGGGDAPNKTLKLLRALKDCAVDATFWVMLGEGYKHSYDDLIAEIRTNKRHEIILARTNKSMWQVLRNCAVGIFSGGVTSYEAVYAGLPSVNLLDRPDQEFLIRELVENNACWNMGVLSDRTLAHLNSHIESLRNDHVALMKMHIDAKRLIGGDAPQRILDRCCATLSAA